MRRVEPTPLALAAATSRWGESMPVLASTPLEAELLAANHRPLDPLPANAPRVHEPGHGAELVARAHGVRKGEPLVLRRSLAPALLRDLEALLPLGHDVRDLDLFDAVQLDRLVSGLPEPQRAWLRADVAALADALRELTGTSEVRGSLYVASHDHCRKLHVDAGGLRLLVTYAGPGTQLIVDQEAARPVFARRRQLTLDAFNAELIQAGGFRQIQAGDVVLMRGDAGPGEPGCGVIHRSPPVASAGLSRLLLKLDVPLPPGSVRPSRPLRALPASDDAPRPCARVRAIPAEEAPRPCAGVQALPVDDDGPRPCAGVRALPAD